MRPQLGISQGLSAIVLLSSNASADVGSFWRQRSIMGEAKKLAGTSWRRTQRAGTEL